MSSQRTFQSILGKFSGGLEVLKTVTDYHPTKLELQIASLETLKSDAESKNAAVVNTATILQTFRNNRRFISFRGKETDVNCIENLFKNIASYIKAELGEKDAAYQKIRSIIKKINPVKEKKEEPAAGEEPKKSISSSEKSYQSLVGFGSDVLTLITNLGTAYNPSNTNLTVANFKSKIDELANLNSAVVKAEADYNAAIDARDEIYNGNTGINNIIPMIKNYLASLEGGKSNPSYVAFINAVK